MWFSIIISALGSLLIVAFATGAIILILGLIYARAQDDAISHIKALYDIDDSIDKTDDLDIRVTKFAIQQLGIPKRLIAEAHPNLRPDGALRDLLRFAAVLGKVDPDLMIHYGHSYRGKDTKPLAWFVFQYGKRKWIMSTVDGNVLIESKFMFNLKYVLVSQNVSSALRIYFHPHPQPLP